MISPDKVRDSLERALEFYDEHHIPVPGRPRTRIVENKKNRWGADAIFFGPKIHGLEQEFEFYVEHFSREVWRSHLRINLSKVSAREIELSLDRLIDNYGCKVVPNVQLLSSTPTIVVFKPRGSDPYRLVHEVGHHIEAQSKSKHPFVSEGIANYFQQIFQGEYLKAERVNDIDDFTNEYVCRVVHQLVNKHRFSERDLFDSDARGEISDFVKEKLMPRGAALYLAYRTRGSQAKLLKEAHLNSPEFEPVFGNVSKKSITEAYEAIGAKKFAASIYTQNMDSMIRQFKRWGF